MSQLDHAQGNPLLRIDMVSMVPIAYNTATPLNLSRYRDSIRSRSLVKLTRVSAGADFVRNFARDLMPEEL